MLKMSTAKARDIESLMGELRVARLLYINGHQLRFVEAPGSGAIHDLEIDFPDGTVIYGETKCKLTTTAFSAETVTNALSKAADKFNGDVPGVIFLNFPQDWYDSAGREEVHKRIRDTAEAFFDQGRSETKPQNTRVLAAVFYCEPLTVAGETITQGHDHAVLINRWNKFDRSKDWRLLTYTPPPGLYWKNLPVKWIRLTDLPAELLKHAQAN